MPFTDDILDFIRQANGKTPEELSSLERQFVAVAAVAVANKFTRLSGEKLLINPVTRNAAAYVARHPLATLAAYWFAEWKNSSYRPQGWGPYSREIDTVIYTAVFGQAPRILKKVGAGVRLLFKPRIGEPAGKLFRLLGKISVPKISPKVVINPVTVGAVRYVAAHPAALLASYFVANYIDRTYRPQFFGRFTEEVIFAGTFPILAHAPRAVPWAIRGAGSAAYWASRGVAMALDFLLISPRPVVTIGQPVRQAFGTRAIAVARAGIGGIRSIAGRLPKGKRALAGLGVFAAVEAWQWYNFIDVGIDIANSGEKIPWYQFYKYFKYAEWYQWPAFIPGIAEIAGALAGIGPAAAKKQALHVLKGVVNFSRLITRPLSPLLTRTASLLGRTGAGSLGRIASLALPRLSTGLIGTSRVLSRILGTAFRYSGWPLFLATSIPDVVNITADTENAMLDLESNLVRTSGTVDFLVNQAGRSQRASEIQRELALCTAAVRNYCLVLIGGGNASREDRRTFLGGFFSTYSATHLDRLQDLAEAADARSEVLLAELQQLAVGTRIFEAFEGVGPELLETIRPLYFAYRNAQNAIQSFLPTEQGGVTVNGVYSDNPSLQPVDDLYGPFRFFGGGQGRKVRSARTSIAVRRRRLRDQSGKFIKDSFEFSTGQPLLPTGLDQVLAYINSLVKLSIITAPANAAAGHRAHPTSAAAHPGGSGREFWLYRGRDRNLLLQTLRDMDAIQERDTLEESGKKTTTISVREPIFPDTVPGLRGKVIVLTRALRRDSLLVRDRFNPSEYYLLEQVG